MRTLTHILVLFVLLGAVLGGGCRRGPGVTESRLIALDSLIGTSPDSALALLQAVDTAALSDADRAYLDLLQTQALYKAYIPATDSTAICRAWRYYKDNGPYDRRIRAMLYRGTVAEEMGDPEEAMRWYKRTELTSHYKEDDFNSGYALMTMGELYQTNGEDRRSIDKYRMALDAFAGHYHEQQLFCCQQLSQIYQQDDIQPDSSAFFIDEAICLATAMGDSAALAVCLTNLAEKSFYADDYLQAKSQAVDAIQRFGHLMPYGNCWYIASQSYVKMGIIDSAEWYLSRVAAPATANDSIWSFQSQELLASSHGDWQKARSIKMVCDHIIESAINKYEGSALVEAEEKAISEYNIAEKDRINLSQKKVWWLAISVALILMLLSLVKWRKGKRREAQLSQMLVSIKTKLEELTSLDSSRSGQDGLSPSTTDEESDIKELMGGIDQRIEQERGNGLNHVKAYINKVRRLIDASQQPMTRQFLHNLHQEARINDEELTFWLSELSSELISLPARQFFDEIEKRCELSDTERIVLKLVALEFSDAEIQILMGARSDDYARGVLSRIKKKAGFDISIRKTFRKLNEV